MRKLARNVVGFIGRLNDDQVGAFAAQAAYFILLSFIPFLMLLMTLVRFTFITEGMVQTLIVQIVPAEFQKLVLEIVSEVYDKSSATVTISAVAALWSAGKGINALTNGFNSVYHVSETRNYVIGRLRAALYTLIFIIAVLASLVLMVFGNTIQKALTLEFPMVAQITSFVLSFRTLFMIISLTLIFLVLYKFIPNRKASFRSQVPGAMISSVAWAIFSLVFSVYLDIFPGFSNMYGSLTTIVMVMLWMYFCMYIILIGAEVNAYFEDKLRRFHDAARQRIRQEYQNFIDHKEEEIQERE